MGDNRWLKNSFVYLIILVAALALFFNYFNNQQNAPDEVAITEVIALAKDNKIDQIKPQAASNDFTFTRKDTPNKTFRSRLEANDSITDLLVQSGVDPNNVDVIVQPAPAWGGLLNIFTILLPVLLMIGFFIFFMRQAQGSNNQALSFGKSRARMFSGDKPTITFADVAGQEEAKQDLTEVVEFLKFPDKFAALGARIPRGVLMVGPPGTGKTLLSRAVAGEAGVPFFSISGSEFVEMFVGVGASRVRDLFDQAKRNAPCIVFIDEIDAVGRQRGAGLGGGNDEREQTLNQLLVEMDGFEANEGVILIAATNRPDVLDPALLRPGRFDRQVIVPNPDVGGREKILKVHMRKVPLAPDVDPRVLARGTPGFSGADLANLVNEAALRAARVGKRLVTMGDFEYAKDKVLMGTERRSMAMTNEEKTLTAYHEAGHALVAMHVPKSDPLHKVTIIPRGRALGVTMQLPERDHLSHTKQYLESRLAIMFGGRLAEELVFGPENVTTGAASDIQVATQTARGMITAYGMSEKLGRVRYQANEQEVFLGHAVTQTQNVSEATAQLIDQEVRRLIEEAEGRARTILTEHLEDLHTISRALLEYETLSNDEIGTILRGEKVVRDDTGGAGTSDRRRRASVPTTTGPAPGASPEPQPGV